MSDKSISRRNLLKGTVAATAGLALSSQLATAADSKSDSKFDAKGLPTTTLGKTGARVPRMALGTGSLFYVVEEEDKSLEILTYALDHGLYYWDTAHAYASDTVVSEERLGKIVKDRRNEIFLSTKVGARDPDEAKRHVEESLKRLQTDHLDILKIHSVNSVEDAKAIIAPGGVLEVVQKLRDQGVAKYIGFTGHTTAEGMTLLAKSGHFDTMLMSLNHYVPGEKNFERQAMPTAAKNGLGVMVMKAIRPRQMIPNLNPHDLIRYALTLEHVNAVIVAHSNLGVLKENIAMLKNFKPLDEAEMEALRVSLAPFYRHERLPWMRSHYRDGGGGGPLHA